MSDDIDPWRADEENSYQEHLREVELRAKIYAATIGHEPKNKQRREGFDLAVRLIVEAVTEP